MSKWLHLAYRKKTTILLLQFAKNRKSISSKLCPQEEVKKSNLNVALPCAYLCLVGDPAKHILCVGRHRDKSAESLGDFKLTFIHDNLPARDDKLRYSAYLHALKHIEVSRLVVGLGADDSLLISIPDDNVGVWSHRDTTLGQGETSYNVSNCYL